MHDKAHEILIWIFFPILYPLGRILTYYGFGELHPSDWATEYSIPYLRSYRNQVPKPVLQGRRRRLTLPSSDSRAEFLSVNGQKTKEQSQSLLFSKFPAEIRIIIFGMALSGDGQVLHIVRPTREHFSHIRCTLPLGRCRDYQCFTYWTPDVENPRKRGTFHRTHGCLLPLLLTCRKLYVKAIPPHTRNKTGIDNV